MQNNERIECRVTGRVQMVMYRDFTRRKARKLGLLGFVRNDSDGSVMVVAEGLHELLEQFITSLYKGSVWSRVDNIEAVWKEAVGDFNSFNIIY